MTDRVGEPAGLYCVEGERMIKELIEWVKALLIAAVIGVTLSFFFTVLQVYDVSMNPTLVEGDRLVLQNTHRVDKGDIVIFKTTLPISEADLQAMNPIQRWKNGRYKTLIKRVVATEGDSLVIEDGQVILNGEPLEEAYILEPYTSGAVSIDKVPPGMVFAMGDNRQNSHDSRSDDIGLLPAAEIKGKVLLRFWPLNRLGSF